jgi:hypothetical protein
MACSGVSRAIGGSTPNASAVRKTTFFGWPAAPGGHVVADVVQRVAGARVLGDRLVLELHAARVVEHHVLEHRAEHLRRR